MQTRRAFIKSASIAAGLSAMPGFVNAEMKAGKVYRAAVIGRTGKGDYGHGYDMIFKGLDNVELVAVADENPEGLKKAQARTGAQRAYTNYRELLEKEKPDLVSIAPRWPDCHREMALAAIEVGAHIFMEKPIAENLSDADDIVKAAEKKGIKIAIAHNRRYNTDFLKVKGLIEEGFLGTIREFRTDGKQDGRSGGEDLIVLGTHDFDIMRFYFGDPLWCFANVMKEGRDASRADVARGKEPILVAGDTLFAEYGFTHSIHATWSSIRTADHWNTNFSPREKWAFQITGTKRIIGYQSGFGFAYLDSPFLVQKKDTIQWADLPEPQKWKAPDHVKHFIKDLIHAIETDTQSWCSGYDGRWALEMVAAVYASHKIKGRVDLPLKDRRNPLLTW